MLPSKWENLSCCPTIYTHFCKNYHLHCTARRANILCIYILFQFWEWFFGSFWKLFLKASASCGKKNWNNFCCIVLLFVWVQKVSQIFKILFQTGDVNIFVHCGVFFSGYVQLKSSFSDKNNISGKIWDTL